jgi:RNA polymerase sigma-70 factor, ECF subfamily
MVKAMLATELPQFERSSDEQIVQRVVQGDRALFEILMRRNNTRVYRAVRSLLRDESEVEDAMQAAYVRAYAKLDTFRGGSRFSTWLIQIALNEALGRLRQKRRHPAVSLTLVEDTPMPSNSTPPLTPEAQLSQRELSVVLERAVDSLPELYRVVFMLRDVDGMDTADAARALGVTEDVVKTRLSRARAALRQQIERLVGAAAKDAFGFQAPRCDRVVANVLEKLFQ